MFWGHGNFPILGIKYFLIIFFWNFIVVPFFPFFFCQKKNCFFFQVAATYATGVCGILLNHILRNSTADITHLSSFFHYHTVAFSNWNLSIDTYCKSDVVLFYDKRVLKLNQINSTLFLTFGSCTDQLSHEINQPQKLTQCSNTKQNLMSWKTKPSIWMMLTVVVCQVLNLI